jgi:hypothetical protein
VSSALLALCLAPMDVGAATTDLTAAALRDRALVRSIGHTRIFPFVEDDFLDDDFDDDDIDDDKPHRLLAVASTLTPLPSFDGPAQAGTPAPACSVVAGPVCPLHLRI